MPLQGKWLLFLRGLLNWVFLYLLVFLISSLFLFAVLTPDGVPHSVRGTLFEEVLLSGDKSTQKRIVAG